MGLKNAACALGLILVLSLPAARATEIGDPAPELQIASWVKGGPVDLSAAKGKIVVIEFWATWCGPCLQSIPHLTELQKKYKDQGVVMIGITDEPASVAQPFVEKMGDNMGYAVAVDQRRATHRNYMGAFGAQGIPYAFVIDKAGAIAWHGHPLAGLDSVLDRIVTGKFDIKRARQESIAGKTIEQYLQIVEQWNATTDTAQRSQLEEKAKAAGAKVLEQAANSPDLLNDFATAIVLMPGTEYRDTELAARAAEAAFKASEQKPADKTRKLMHDYFRTIQASSAQTLPAEQKRRLDDISAQILAQPQAEELKAFAWTILAAPDLKHRDLQLAVKAGQAAVKASNEQDPTALDTYARALFETGQREQAIAYARKAVELNKDEHLEPILKESLERYEKGAPQSAGR